MIKRTTAAIEVIQSKSTRIDVQALKAAQFIYVWLFCRRIFYAWHRRLLKVAVHGMGYGNPTAGLILPGEDRLLKRLAFVPGLVVFDVGAHAGEYAQRVRKFCPTAKIWCFEPNPASFERLREVSRAVSATAVNLGLSDSDRIVSLYDLASPRTGAGSPQASMEPGVIETLYGQASTHQEVRATTIDAFLASSEIPRVNLLKVDTEGHEAAVLRGARKAIIEGRIDVVQFESNEMNVMSRTFFRDYYDALPGFSFYRMLIDGLAPLGEYRPRTHELFFFQNVVAIRGNLSYLPNLL